jgi:glyoxylase-like metal-dependent hydrolase (beta-lactamase superfamily II)
MCRVLNIFIFVIFSTRLYGQVNEGEKLRITALTDSFYIYTTYNSYKGSLVSANGMYLVTTSGVVMFDTPWDTTQFQPLLDTIKTRHNKSVIICIATHFHEDRTGGLEYYGQKGIKTYTSRQTDELSRKRGMKRAEYLLNNDSVFTIGDYSFQTFFPGQGHAPDNIVIWFEKQRILYGSCLIKSLQDETLGNLGDANIKEYARTIKNIQRRFKKPKYIITGHNDWRDNRSLDHTLKMAMKVQWR